MRLNYVLGRADLLVFYKKYLKENSVLFKPYIFDIALVVAILIRYSSGPTKITSFPNGVESIMEINFFVDSIFYFVLLIGLIFFLRYRSILKIENTIIRNPSLIGERELELLENKIVLNSGDSMSEYNISSIKKFEVYKEHFYIYIDKQIAIVVPKKINDAESLISYFFDKKIELIRNPKKIRETFK